MEYDINSIHVSGTVERFEVVNTWGMERPGVMV